MNELRDKGQVRIVGGGLTGILAAFEAHRLGCRDIVLHERFDTLGGGLSPRQAHGLELRDACVYFGPRGEATRRLMEDHGLVFEDFENRLGSVSPAPGGDIAITHDFGGPALPARELVLVPPVGERLTDRLRAYPKDIAEPLTRYCQWRLGTWLDEVHADAMTSLGAHRVFPLGPDIVQIAARKRSDRLYDDLYGLPRSLWGRLDDATASLPRGGFAHLFAQGRRALKDLGVDVQAALISPRQVMAERQPNETVVWTADPAPLYETVGLEAPKPVSAPVATYVLKAKYDGHLPFHVQNFTASGAIFRIYLYESRGQTLVLAECVRECGDAELRREIHRLMSGFGGATLALGEPVDAGVASRAYPSVDGVRKLAVLRAALARSTGAGFIVGDSFQQVNTSLAAALDAESAAASAA